MKRSVTEIHMRSKIFTGRSLIAAFDGTHPIQVGQGINSRKQDHIVTDIEWSIDRPNDAEPILRMNVYVREKP